MKKVLAICICLLGFGAAAFAQEYEESSWRPYFRADAQAAYSAFTLAGSNGDQDLTGFQGVYDFALGANYKRGRFELAYQKRGAVSDAIFLFAATTAFVDNDAVLANAYYDFVKAGFFSMYIGGGMGVNKWSSEITSFGHTYSDDGYAFIGGAYLGMSFAIYMVNLDFGMNYYYISKLDMNTLGFMAGVRINF